MSKKSKQDNSQEPWDQPIYGTEGEESYSRSTQRHQKRGSSAFLTVVLILLFLIVAVPTIAGFWVYHRNAQPAPVETVQTSSSEMETSSTEQSTSSDNDSSESAESSEADSASESTESTEASESSKSSDSSEANDSSEESDSSTTSDSSEEQTPESSEETTTPDENSQSVITVLDGEGPQQVADRAGISLDTLFQLNGIDPNNYMLYPGQELVTK